MLKRLVVVLVLGSAVVWTAVALATPSHGSASVIVAQGTLQADVAYNTGLAVGTTGITWDGKQYTANQLPEFLIRLRSAGVTDVGEWLNLHPAVSAKFGMVAMGILHNPRGRDPADDLRSRICFGLAQPSRLPRRDGHVGPGRPVRR